MIEGNTYSYTYSGTNFNGDAISGSGSFVYTCGMQIYVATV